MAEHAPTDESRATVRALAGLGLTREEIGVKLDVSTATIIDHYLKDIEQGRVEAKLQMQTALFKRGLAGNANAASLWLTNFGGGF